VVRARVRMVIVMVKSNLRVCVKLI
jgi:hypothetical protein